MTRTAAALAVCSLLLTTPAVAGIQDTVASLAGKDGVVLAVDKDGKVLASHNANTTFTPASTLKVITTLLAADTLGLDSRFETDFWVQGDLLLIRGKGDPFLVSEELDLLVKDLAPKLTGTPLRGVAIDDSWFIEGITIPAPLPTRRWADFPICLCRRRADDRCSGRRAWASPRGLWALLYARVPPRAPRQHA